MRSFQIMPDDRRSSGFSSSCPPAIDNDSRAPPLPTPSTTTQDDSQVLPGLSSRSPPLDSYDTTGHSSSSSSPPCLSRFPSERSAEDSNSAVRDTLNRQEQVSPTAVREPTTAPRPTDTGRPDRSLPPFVPISTPNFHWGNLNAEDFSHVITCAYAEIVHWRRNVFMVPSGKAGKRFVQERDFFLLTQTLQQWKASQSKLR